MCDKRLVIAIWRTDNSLQVSSKSRTDLCFPAIVLCFPSLHHNSLLSAFPMIITPSHHPCTLLCTLSSAIATVDLRAYNEGKMLNLTIFCFYQMIMWRTVHVTFLQISQLTWRHYFNGLLTVKRNAVTLVCSCLLLPYVILHLFPLSWPSTLGLVLSSK